MRHARDDYNRIQDPAGKIPKDEPVFLLRGQDFAAPPAVRAWANEAESMGAAPSIVAAARAQADAMESWQREHKGKLPDMPRPATPPKAGTDGVGAIPSV